MKALSLLAPDVIARHDERTGATYLRSRTPLLEPLEPTLGEVFLRAARRTPSRVFLASRGRTVTYEEARQRTEALALSLAASLPPRAPVVALSGNSVDHALLMIACFLAGAPFVPISPAYSLMSHDFGKLGVVLDKVRPGLVFVETREPFERALSLPSALATRVVTANDLEPLAASAPAAGAVALPSVTADDTAKVLFTSGSTGFPKGVPNTHGMLCKNQQMIAQLWPFLAEESSEGEVLVDWLPWSHTFGGNHNFNLVLYHGGTLHLDEGRPGPTPAALEPTLANLRAISPTLYFNVPAGYAALVPHLERDDGLRRAFFAQLKVIFYAAAALPADLWRRLLALAERTVNDREVLITTAWGSTETSPLATSMHFQSETSGNIGLPAPGMELKLLPNGAKQEIRLKGPTVMRGYLDEPDLTAAAFDDEGFYRIGDAVRFADPSDPSKGLLFDGRVAEDFKLSSGTWVSVTHVRTGFLAEADGLLADVVVCGQDRDFLALLAWPHLGACATRGLSPEGAATLDEVSSSAPLRARVREVMAAWNAAHPASSMRVARVLLLRTPPSIDGGEITDKGYTNQRATAERRASDVARLYASAPDDEILEAGESSSP